jgi:hypothetical protein
MAIIDIKPKDVVVPFDLKLLLDKAKKVQPVNIEKKEKSK